MRYRILPYRQGSKGAKAFADALPRGRVLKLVGSTFRPARDDVLINWGCTEPPREMNGWMHLFKNGNINLLKDATNKRSFFQKTERNDPDIIPRFWTNRNDIPDDAFPIVCRTVLAGHSGAGIVLADTRNDLVDAPLYVQYVKKQEEFRVHVGLRNGEATVIATQRKARRRDVADDNINWQVRNHQNGFIYAREGFVTPDCVIDVARRALLSTGLAFGAVDVIYNSRQGRAYVLEVNTAPGLEGQTVTDYVNFFTGV